MRFKVRQVYMVILRPARTKQGDPFSQTIAIIIITTMINVLKI